MTSTPVATTGHPSSLSTAATVGALSVVYGDIGTSPLYALKEAAKAATHGAPLTHAAILGVVSLILWSLILRFPDPPEFPCLLRHSRRRVSGRDRG